MQESENVKADALRRILMHELADLFAFCSPAKLRRNIEDLFFRYLLEANCTNIDEQKELVSSVHHLINFLNEAEKIVQLQPLTLEEEELSGGLDSSGNG
ncbi:MAG: hypothetical protein JXR03_09540 [Cyclobacteriaceae bacterium]